MNQQLTFVLYIVFAFVAAGLISYFATPIAKVFAHKVGAIDVPKDNRRMHKEPIPRMGGLAIFFGFLISVLIFADIDKQLQGILLGAVLIVILGILDDILALPAWLKFIVQICAALIAVGHGVVVEFISNPIFFSENHYLNLGWLSIPLTVIWIVLITNAVNLIDGLDGLAAGISAISSISLFVVALIVAESGNIAIIMVALAGACIGFLPHNFYPAKIFMGDTGSTFLGFILGTLSIQGLFKMYAVISFFVPFLIIGLPFFDTIAAIIRRLAKGQNPMRADRGHVHHKLIDMGFSQKQVVAILYSITLLLGLAAVVFTTRGVARFIIIAVAVVIVIVVSLEISKMNLKNHSNAAHQENDTDDTTQQEHCITADKNSESE